MSGGRFTTANRPYGHRILPNGHHCNISLRGTDYVYIYVSCFSEVCDGFARARAVVTLLHVELLPNWHPSYLDPVHLEACEENERLSELYRE